MFCQKCGRANDITAKFCAGCGNTLSQPAQDEFIPPTKISSQAQKNELYKTIIGPKNQDYYLKKFSQFDTNGGSISWHWPAAFATFPWLIYRGMWFNALIYSTLILTFNTINDISIFLGMALVIPYLIIPPIYADKIYHNYCNRKIAPVVGKASWQSIAINTTIIVVCLLTIIINLTIGELSKQEKSNVSKAVDVGEKLTASITNYYNQHQKVTSNLVEAGFSEALPPSVKSVRIDNENGVVTLTLTEGKTLLFVPSLDENLKMSWQCMSNEIEGKHLPTLCRQAK